MAPGAAVPGSIATLFGAQLAGNKVQAGFDGLPAQILFDNNTQINLVVPSALGKKQSSQLIVIVDGTASLSETIPLVNFSPGIFKNGVLNQDSAVNSSDHPARLGTILQIFGTGLSGTGVITVRINGAVIDALAYAGPAPGIAGVQQVNVQLPADLKGTAASVSLCGGIAGKADQATCSPAVQVAIVQ
jgi:uncharacterized protein (TIGR03437 family)